MLEKKLEAAMQIIELQGRLIETLNRDARKQDEMIARQAGELLELRAEVGGMQDQAPHIERFRQAGLQA